MSCRHGNWAPCELCDEIEDAYEQGKAEGMKSANHCGCSACKITHASDCAVHNMPAMPVGECDCAVLIKSQGSVSDDARDAARYRWLKRQKTPQEILAYIVFTKDVDQAIDDAMQGESHD